MIVIFLGSSSDLGWGKEIGQHLGEFGVSYKIHIASAHKTPEHLLKLLQQYESCQEQIVYICVAGRSNALGGFVDAQTTKPVINCPPYSDKYAGLDVLSSLRMPSGVSSMTVLEPQQAALAAVKILALTNKSLRSKISQFQKHIKEKIVSQDKQAK